MSAAAGYIVLGDGQAACAHRVKLTDKLYHGVRHPGIGIWAEILRAVADELPGKEHPRVKLIGDNNPRIRFVVLKQHIVARLVLLYHGVFKVERILFGRHHDIAHVGNGGHEHIGALAVVCAVEVARHTALEILGLADVNDCARRVVVCVYAGGVGEDGDFLHQLRRLSMHWHNYFLMSLPRRLCQAMGPNTSPIFNHSFSGPQSRRAPA